MSLPSAHVPTIEDAAALDVPEGFKTEIINGRIVVTPSEGWRNALIEARLRNALQKALPPDQYEVVQNVNIGDRFEYFIPDVCVVEYPAFVRAARTKEVVLDPRHVALVVEVVSDDSRSRNRDYGEKAEAYIRRGIGRYWILDPVRQSVTEVTAAGRTPFIDGEIVDGCRTDLDFLALVHLDLA